MRFMTFGREKNIDLVVLSIMFGSTCKDIILLFIAGKSGGK